jgi:hypothetical protein
MPRTAWGAAHGLGGSEVERRERRVVLLGRQAQRVHYRPHGWHGRRRRRHGPRQRRPAHGREVGRRGLFNERTASLGDVRLEREHNLRAAPAPGRVDQIAVTGCFRRRDR